MNRKPEITEQMIDAELSGQYAPPPQRRSRKPFWAALAAVVVAAAVIGTWLSWPRSPEPFTIKADISIGFVGAATLTMTPDDCDLVRTSKGVWRSSSPVIFRQNGDEVGTGDVSSSLGPMSSTGRLCEYLVVGKVSPLNDSDIAAELPDGRELTRPIADWKDPAPYVIELTLDPREALS